MSAVIEKKEFKREKSSNVIYGKDTITFNYKDLLGKDRSLVIKRSEIIDALSRNFERVSGHAGFKVK